MVSHRAVVFDMDGLLLDTESLAMEALEKTGLAMGHATPPGFYQGMIGAPMDRNLQMLQEHFGEDFPAEAFFRASDDLFEDYIESGRLTVKPGVWALLDYLDEQAIPYGLATSSGRSKMERHMHKVGLLPRFRYTITRNEVTHGKPGPEPFLNAARLIGVPPAEALALEDSYNGVRSAFAAGMPVIMVPDVLQPTEEIFTKALAVLPSLNEVLEKFRAGR
ncbi:HAD family hydrolase [Entomobacter blattae]|uniref:Phosphorylated carbohydrates phosphatase n=1 Tax=Entomobacter blattae TaxID=2762277 RepID=A0A7H1NRG2_9PROT|nr:HAD family phosphatase [Entomobacter blattae]QNT78372.1 Phosphorylated carbohydrates phosphatase [Entomobacter blattae]